MVDTVDIVNAVGPEPPELANLPADRQSDTELVRLIGRLLTVTAEKLGVPYQHVGFDDLCQRIITAAQGGKLDPADYRAVWSVWSLLKQH